MPLLILGVVLGVAILGLVHQISMFGSTCYYVGELNMATTGCIPPVLYFGALALAALFVVLGVVKLIREPAQ